MAHKNPTTSKRRAPFLIAGILIIAVAIGAAVLLSHPSENTDSLPVEVSVEEAAKLRDEGAFILDVREDYEWAEGHIPGSTLIPLNELPDRLAEVPQDQLVVVVCRSGNRSQAGRNILLDAGYSKVTSMAGGVSAWSIRGYPIISGP